MKKKNLVKKFQLPKSFHKKLYVRKNIIVQYYLAKYQLFLIKGECKIII